MLTRKQKEELVREVTDTLRASKSVVFVNYRGMTVSDTQTIKRQLRAQGVIYRVLKKKLFDKAAQEAGYEVKTSHLEGQLAVAFSLEDEVSAPKTLFDFSKGNESLELIGGMLEGNPLTQEEVVALAKLPSKQELLAKVVGSMNAPVSGFVRVLSGNVRGLVVALKAIADQKA